MKSVRRSCRPTSVIGVLTASERGTPTAVRESNWYANAVIYELHVRAFSDSNGSGSGDFAGLLEKLDYIRDLGVTAIWLLPFCPSPGKDDGYDISDYVGIHPAYGSLDDFRCFLDECKQRNLKVITELVLNHTSDQHPWFQRARQSPPGSRWRDYYVWSDDPGKYSNVRIIFKDFETSNWAWDPVANAWYWHRFYSHQPDLNYDSPDVQREVLETVDFWFDLGVDGLRLDAVPYLYEREGTTCENLAETHEFLRQLRRHVDSRYEGRMLLAEANQWPEDAVAYFGAGDECHMAFNFPLMPRLFVATRLEDSFPITNIVQRLPVLPEGCVWATFLRNHDELTLEMVCEEERDYMYRMYAESPEMRINLGIRRRLAPLVRNDRRRIELMHALLFSLPGTPVIYYGDEIGMGEDLSLGDRNSVRTPMQWSAEPNAGFSQAAPSEVYLPAVSDGEYSYGVVNVETQIADPHSLLWWMRNALAVRRQSDALTGGDIEFLTHRNRHVLAFLRRSDDEDVLVVANLSRHAQPAELPLGAYAGRTPVEAFGRVDFPVITADPYRLSLTPYGFYWFVLRKPNEPEVLSLESLTLEWSERGELARALRPHIERNIATSWRSITMLGIEDLVRFTENSAIALMRVSFTAGDPELLLIPLTIRTADQRVEGANVVARFANDGKDGRVLCMDGADGVMTDRLLNLIEDNAELATETGLFRGATVGPFDVKGQKQLVCLLPNVSDDEQRNSSIVLSDAFVLKLFRRMESGGNPDIRTVRHLFEDAGFSHVAPVFGTLEYVRADGTAFDAGVLHAFVDSSQTLWSMAVNELSRHLECAATGCAVTADLTTGSPQPFLETCRLLGVRTAQLHLALAHPESSDFAPEPFTSFYTRGVCHAMCTRAALVGHVLRNSVSGAEQDDDTRRVLSLIDSLDSEFADLTNIGKPGVRLRIHGDLHLGQVLHTGADVAFIDFEGDSSRPLFERLIKASPLVDVASLVCSFRYVASRAVLGDVAGALSWRGNPDGLEHEANEWYRSVTASLLSGYREKIAGTGLVPDSDSDFERALRAYLLAKAVYQVGYELDYRPEWAPVALRTLIGISRA